MVDDEEFLELVELEVREFLSDYDFDGDNIFIVVGFVLKVVEVLIKKLEIGKGEDEWVDKIFVLMDEVDGYIFELECDVDKLFLMVVEDVFFIMGCGIVVIGWIECGKIKVGEIVELVGIKDICNSIVIGVEMF